MLYKKDLKQLEEKGITESQLETQLHYFETGFPYLEIVGPAEIDNGILALNHMQIAKIREAWDDFTDNKCTIVKFVPASGAASRMFKNLFEFLNGPDEKPQTEFMSLFFDRLEDFAFYEDLKTVFYRNNEVKLEDALAQGQYKQIVAALLEANGLNYGALPKGLLKFHKYPLEVRTPFMEHLVEGALYAANNEKEVRLHFTVSENHLDLFQQHCQEHLDAYSKRMGVKYIVEFSTQKSSTDTVAATVHNRIFRDNDGSILFRPGGHGALIENLNQIDADVIFIKNIDNVVPDKLKETTVFYKQVIGGVLVSLQQRSFAYLKELENAGIRNDKLMEIKQFCTVEFNNRYESIDTFDKAQLIAFLQRKLNRPMRVCGMVKNQGEPGGGPYLVRNADGTVSPQILESSQIDLNNKKYKEMMARSTYFNPVDLVCGVKNYKGEKFNLPDYVDKQTGFISSKSKNGKTLKALELPGLWNGAMSDWNTIFVEVPVETFNPVKTVNDLLREEHQ